MEEWANSGIVRIPGYLPEGFCADICERLDSLVRLGYLQRRTLETKPDPQTLNEGGILDYYIADGYLCREAFPEVFGVYLATRSLIEQWTGSAVALSPYPRSELNLNRYDAPGGQMSAHCDSNSISVVVYLTTNETDGATEFLSGGMVYRSEYPRAGDLLLFKGSRILHQSAPVRSGVKVAAILNYYTPDDVRRPEGLDELMYGD